VAFGSARENAGYDKGGLGGSSDFRFGSLSRVPGRSVLRSDNGQVFTSRRYTATAKAYGLSQEFITPHTPAQKFIRTLKEECPWQHRFRSVEEVSNIKLDKILQIGETTSDFGISGST